MDARKTERLRLQYFDIQHIKMPNMQHTNLLIPPKSEPTPFVTAFSMSRMQFLMIWDVGLGSGAGADRVENMFK